MPDRSDPFIPPGFDGDMTQFPVYSNDTPTVAGTLTSHDQFNPDVERELVNGRDVTDGTPNTWEDAHPDQTYTAFRSKILRRANYISIPAFQGTLPPGLLLKGGRTMLGGVSLTSVATSGWIALRDGMDSSAPIVQVFKVNDTINPWFGDGGPEYRFGVYMDLTGVTGGSFLAGSIFILKDYAQ